MATRQTARAGGPTAGGRVPLGPQQRVARVIADGLTQTTKAGRLTYQQIANRLNSIESRTYPDITGNMVKNWATERSAVGIEVLPHLARLLRIKDPGSPDPGYDPRYIVRLLGLLNDEPPSGELIDKAYRLQKLEQKLVEAQRGAAAFGRSRGAAEVVHAAVRTGQWAAAVWPAVEGPPGYRMHVADRIDLRRIDNSPVSRDDVWSTPQLQQALRAAYAVQSGRAPRWVRPGEGTEPTEPGAGRVSSWSIPHVGGPRGPMVSVPHPGLATIAFTATTLDSWVHDVAALTSLALGYGLTTTRDLAMEASGLPSAQTRPDERFAIHEHLLAAPPRRRVWSHHGLTPPGRRVVVGARNTFLPGRPVVHVRLVESDELLARAAKLRSKGPNAASVGSLRADRDRMRNDVLAYEDQAHVILVDVERQASSHDRWRQVLEGVRQVLNTLRDNGGLPAEADGRLREAQALALRDEPAIAGPAFRWLAARGCRAVMAQQ